MAYGTLSMEDIYSVGSLDTVPGTSEMTNINDPSLTGSVEKGKESIMHLPKGNFMGQPIMVWVGMIGVLLVLKYLVEGKVA